MCCILLQKPINERSDQIYHFSNKLEYLKMQDQFDQNCISGGVKCSASVCYTRNMALELISRINANNVIFYLYFFKDRPA